MSAFETVKQHLEPGETPLVTGTESFLTAVIDREKSERVSSRTKRVTRWKEPRYTEVDVVFTDRRMIRLGSLQPTGETHGKRTVWKVLSAVEKVPWEDFRHLEVTETKSGFSVEARPYLYRDTALSVDGSSPSASGIPALRRAIGDFPDGIGPDEERRATLSKARERYLALREEESAGQGTSAARFAFVFGGLGASVLSSMILLYTGYSLVWGMVTMVTARSDYMQDLGAKAFLCNTPWVVVMGAIAMVGLLVAGLNARTFFGARSRVDRARREIVALRQQTAGG